ncbi:MAG: glycogen/starch synthase, partial [Methanomassiliicoccales archaeon]
MKIGIASSELFPFFKTGGLADYTASISAAISRQNITVDVIIPSYGTQTHSTAAIDGTDPKFSYEIHETGRYRVIRFVCPELFGSPQMYGM